MTMTDRQAERRERRIKSSRQKAAHRQQQIDDLLAEVRKSEAGQLPGWNAFCEAMKVPMDLYPALMTGRTELLDIMQPRALTEAECKTMFDIIKVLVRTNQALQAHAKQVAHMVNIWHDAFKHLHTVGDRIEAFAEFRPDSDDPEDDEE